MRIGILPVWVMAILTASVCAQPAGSELVKAELLADVAQIEPGKPFTVGVLLKIAPQWHVYWKNPGDGGAPTRLQFKLPSGFSVGEINYPVPVQFEQPGNIVGYGYEDEVMLTATITPPKTLKPGASVSLQAGASWLVCHDVCIMGSKDLRLELPVAETAQPANQELFQQWAQRMPSRQPMISVEPYKGGADEKVIVRVELDQPREVEWFPGPPDHFDLEDVETAQEGNVAIMRFRPEPAVKGSVLFPILVAYTDEQGQRRGVEQEVEIGKMKLQR
jgi:DsbC/DsbD-like thiol-disulfide interchange protein